LFKPSAKLLAILPLPEVASASHGHRGPGTTAGNDGCHPRRAAEPVWADASVGILDELGGKKDGVGAFYIGRASGLDALAAFLLKLGVAQDDVDSALQVLAAQPHHQIPNVTLTKAFLRTLGS
jgi:hypothetical protein